MNNDKPLTKAQRQKKRYHEDPEYRERVLARKRKHYAKNKKRIREQQNEYYNSLPPDVRRERSKDLCKKFKKKTKTVPGYRRAYNAWQRAYRCLRLPKWVKMDDFLEIYRKVDELCTKHGEDSHVVDHIIPLRGIKVSGLHVPENLQILTRAENREKANKFEPFEE